VLAASGAIRVRVVQYAWGREWKRHHAPLLEVRASAEEQIV